MSSHSDNNKTEINKLLFKKILHSVLADLRQNLGFHIFSLKNSVSIVCPYISTS